MAWGRVLLIVFQLIVVFMFANASNTFAHSPHDVIEALEVSPGYHQDKTLYIIVWDKFLKSTDGGYSWKELAKGLNRGTFLSSIAISPTFSFDRTLFTFKSYRPSYIYKSQDGGSSWVEANKGLNGLPISKLSLSSNYHSDQVGLAAGTDGGLYKTKNGGMNWYQVLDDSTKINSIAFFPSDQAHNIVIGDIKGNLYLSNDRGETFTHIYKIKNCGAVTSIAISPEVSSDGTYFVGTEKCGVFKTVDTGRTFFRISEGLSAEYITSLSISPNYGEDFSIFASTWYEAIFNSHDAGNTWTKFETGLTTDPQADEEEFFSPHFRDIRISKSFSKDQTIFLGGFDGLFKSTNGGNTWTQMETRLAKTIVGLTVSPESNNGHNIAVTTYDAGAYITHNRRMKWEVMNNGLQHTHLFDIAFSPNFSFDNTIFTSSNHHFYKSTNTGRNWDRIDPVDQNRRRSMISKLFDKLLHRTKQSSPKVAFPWVLSVSPTFTSDGTIYMGTRYLGLFRSRDSGVNWYNILKVKWIKSLAISPDFSSDGTLYVGGKSGIHKTEDGGDTWQLVSNKSGEICLAISPDYKSDKMLFAGTKQGLFKTKDRGKTWQKLEGSAYGSNGYIITIAISPNYKNDKTLVVSVQGKGLFKSTDAGRTFLEVGHELINNNHRIRLLRFSPTYSRDHIIYAASREELFYSKDNGNTWNLISRPVRYEDRKKDVIIYQGNWEHSFHNDFSARSVMQSSSAGAKADLSFVGTGIYWVGTTSNAQGIANIYIDGHFKGHVDQYSAMRNLMVSSYSVEDLAFGPHTITVEVSGNKNPRSTGYRIEIDAFDILP
jgi:photosystem II stability/assembly factor-like uncharacterized protein